MRIALLLLLASASANAAKEETFPLARYFALKACNEESQCMGPIPEEKESSGKVLKLEPFKKGTAEGWHAYDNNEIVENGITIKSVLHVIKHKKKGKYKYFIYAMIRTGKREGKVLMLNLKSLKDFKETVLSDKPTPITRGTLQAQLVFGPPQEE